MIQLLSPTLWTFFDEKQNDTVYNLKDCILITSLKCKHFEETACLASLQNKYGGLL